MGGATTIYLRNKSEENINEQNKKLGSMGVSQKYRFYSEADIFAEWESFLNKTGVFPEQLFPRGQITTYQAFKQFWHPNNIGTAWGIEIGTLNFDCYFGRTKTNALKKIAKYIIENLSEIEKVSGSFSTLMEVMTEKQRLIINKSHLKNK